MTEEADTAAVEELEDSENVEIPEVHEQRELQGLVRNDQ